LEVPAKGRRMKKVSISDIRDLVSFSGINVVASKQGTGLIHLYAENENDLSNFAGVARVNCIDINIDNLRPTSGYVNPFKIGA
jgi:hypothetical protein